MYHPSALVRIARISRHVSLRPLATVARSTTDIHTKSASLTSEEKVSDHPMLIDGKLVQSSSGTSVAVINPATGESFDYVPCATRDDLDTAVSAAARAFKTWSTTPFEDRAKCLLKFGKLIEAKKDALSKALTMEQGKPLRAAAGEAVGMARACKHYAKIGDLKPEILSEDAAAVYKLVYAPRGVVGGITPWNYPLMMAASKLVPSVIVGNTVVLKPSPYTPITTVMLAELALEAFPAGVVNILTGGDDLGQMMVEHPQIAQISFTGSAATGKRVMATGAAQVKKMTLELGGNDPAIVLPDADPKEVAPKVFGAAMLNTGQVCVAIKRLFVHESRYEQMVDALREEAIKAKAKMNDGLVEGTRYGPINNKMQVARVEELVEDAKEAGARVVAGGKRFSPNGMSGYFYEPTVLADVQEGVRVVDEEQFGPVLPVLKYSDVDEAVERANNTDFGLGGSVWTDDLDKGAELAARIQAGVKGVNAHPGAGEHTPFGGVKQSGIGREGGAMGLKEFVDVTTLRIAKVGIGKK